MDVKSKLKEYELRAFLEKQQAKRKRQEALEHIKSKGRNPPDGCA